MIDNHNRFTIPASYVAAKDLLAARVILVTGAGTDLGGMAARAFASHGATVVLLDHDVPAIEIVYDDIVQAGAPEPAIYPMNLMGATPTDYEELAERIGDEFDRLDGLLHARIELGVPSPIEHYDIVQWARVIQVNLHAPFLLTRACLPLLKRAEDASVIFTSADVGRRGRAYWGAYGVSSFAIEGLIQILADELETRSGLRVNGIDPSAVRTRLRAAAYPAEDPMTLPHPEEIMPAYLFLMGKDSQSLNGIVVTSH
ncbi:MAG: YciK family oxidoreductase [Gammaproteobacteria bacterium]|nr:YciK family oxidoreductase [Gammaproteobacteria bacterium]NNJ83571.1 YciK family oxidoreductase [Gammaproteobacteria bacterium]